MTHKTIGLQAGIVLCNTPGIMPDNLPGSHQADSFYNKIIMAKHYDRLKVTGSNLSAIYSFNKFRIIGIQL